MNRQDPKVTTEVKIKRSYKFPVCQTTLIMSLVSQARPGLRQHLFTKFNYSKSKLGCTCFAIHKSISIKNKTNLNQLLCITDTVSLSLCIQNKRNNSINYSASHRHLLTNVLLSLPHTRLSFLIAHTQTRSLLHTHAHSLSLVHRHTHSMQYLDPQKNRVAK